MQLASSVKALQGYIQKHIHEERPTQQLRQNNLSGHALSSATKGALLQTVCMVAAARGEPPAGSRRWQSRPQQQPTIATAPKAQRR
jgi:hypothetical protein